MASGKSDAQQMDARECPASGSSAARFDRLVANDHSAFDALPSERREAVIDAALEEFGAHEYAHALTATIAQRAGISKGSLFFYFRNKRELYLYVMDWLTERMTELVVDEEYRSIDDFFELMRYASTKKATVFRRFPRALDFCVRAYYPRHRDVKRTMDDYLATATAQAAERYLSHVDRGRFREDMPMERVLDLLVWMADGYLHQQLRTTGHVDVDALIEELDAWCDMLKRVSYKKEYL